MSSSSSDDCFSSLPSTDPVYWRDTYLYHDKATILSFTPRIKKSENKTANETDTSSSSSSASASAPSSVKEYTIVVDRTIFHAQGGGQPADVGVIHSCTDISSCFSSLTISDEKKFDESFYHSLLEHTPTLFIVSAVEKFIHPTTSATLVLHHGYLKTKDNHSSPSTSLFTVGQSVSLHIDPVLRRLHARLHSGGHLLDLAVRNAGYNWEPSKAYHFISSPYVEYFGTMDAKQKETFVSDVQKQINKLIEEKKPFNISMVDYDRIATKCGLTEPPSYLQKGVEARIVTVNDEIGCPCSGTHVKSSEELKSLTVNKIEKRGKAWRIKYTVQ